jgi:hypothetical protein
MVATSNPTPTSVEDLVTRKAIQAMTKAKAGMTRARRVHLQT